MKLVELQFGKNDNSLESSAAKQKILNKEIDAQKDKIKTLQAALENAAGSFGENDRRTDNWRIKLNEAEATLNDMKQNRQFSFCTRLHPCTYHEWLVFVLT